MNENLMNFWEKWIDGEESIDITIDSMILKYSIINKRSKEGVKDWVGLDSTDKLLSFIKYVLLPSIQITRTIGVGEEQAYLDVCDYEKTINLIETFKVRGFEHAIEDYKRWSNELENIEKSEQKFEETKNFIKKISNEIHRNEDTFVELRLFQNIKSVGESIIKQYEDANKIELLESKFELSKKEIEDLFMNIDTNKFMLKKITTILNERFI